jgi:hypothetical protein
MTRTFSRVASFGLQRLRRIGLVFPVAPYRGRIETEGLAFMARDMGFESFGMPNVEVVHR